MDFVAERNIARFTELLGTETDPGKRAVLESLLQAEKAKLDCAPEQVQGPVPDANRT